MTLRVSQPVKEGVISKLCSCIPITIDWSHYGRKNYDIQQDLFCSLPPPPRRRNRLRKPRPAHLLTTALRAESAHTTSSFSKEIPHPRYDACLAIQQVDSSFDAVVISTLSYFPFRDHEELLQMSMSNLIEVVTSLNERLPINNRILLQSDFSAKTVRAFVEYLVGIKPFGRLGEDDGMF
ncbi:hypothetical protein BKA70DRAFT_1207392 [Coprinopsis sp. MPI-PUGE-AT-0042]|nr:hypothetical protein BKA70DRAFT_1207392 [Coprinopsis sp. MPI-PUGE-AT-0042]